MRKLSLVLALVLLLSSFQVFAVDTEEDVELEDATEVVEEVEETEDEVLEEDEVVEEDEAVEEEIVEEEEAEKMTVQPSTGLKFLVNGEEVVFEAYLINEQNYLKLRDIAMAVNGTEKQFEVEWDGETEQINLTSDEAYTEVGGELAEGDGTPKEAIANKSKIFKDGELVELDAYTINQNNFFKLRDITELFNIGTGWDQETASAIIDTTTDYEVDEDEVDEDEVVEEDAVVEEDEEATEEDTEE